MDNQVRPLTLKQWIAVQLTNNLLNEQNDKLSVFSLMHIRNGMQEEEVKSIPIGSKEWDPKELATVLDQIAATIATGIPGRQQFIIYAHFQSGRREQFPFGKAGEIEVGGIGTEPPTGQGIVVQLMRHNEAIMRISCVNTEQIFTKLLNSMEVMGSMTEKLLSENADVLDVLKQMVLERTVQEHSHKKELLEYERGTLYRQKLLAYAPAMLNQLAGRELIPQSTAESAVFEYLSETLTSEQIEKLSTILTPEQLAPVIGILADKEKAKQAQQQEGNNGTSK